ncbi:MAG: class I SAM-dependent methyltransferase [Desulfovibrionaceae bacterium]|nr:class I SAM-dependent methyltransferase [Desulfovibrionaceae bacterium]
MRWNGAMNLVGTHSWAETLDRLVFDSFELARFLSADILPEAGASAQGTHTASPCLWDLGAGAGLPGIPLRIVWPRGEYWLVEAREKRAIFLSTVLTRIALPGTHVFRGRAEAFMPGRQADCVISRAFMPWPKLLRLVRPYLAPGGYVILLTKEDIEPGTRNAPGPATGWRIRASARYRVGADMRRFYALTTERD